MIAGHDLRKDWEHRDSLKEGAPLRPWLYRMATNACLDAIARDERRAVLAVLNMLLFFLARRDGQIFREGAGPGSEPFHR